MSRPRFVVYRAADGWRWSLRSANGRIVAVGEAHSRKRDAIRAASRISALAETASDRQMEVEGG